MTPKLGREQVLVALIIAGILSMTLMPDSASGEATACLICGERGMADALANVVLFVPLGMALAVAVPRRPRLLYGLPACLSLVIEFVQLFLPGRYPSLSDLVFNTAGGVAGVALMHASRIWLRLPERTKARLAIAAATVLTGVVSLTGILLEPDFPLTRYYGQWTPNLGHLEWYRGRVLSARIGTLEAPSSMLARQGEVREAMVRGSPIQVRAMAGPPVRRLASLFSVYDENRQEVVLIGPRAQDLVVRFRTRSVAMRLDRPSIRLSGAMAGISPGDTFDVTYWRASDGPCVALAGRFQACNLRFTPGRGWALVSYSEAIPGWLLTAFDIAWVFALVLPVGFGRSLRWEWGLAVALAGGALIALPRYVGLNPVSPWELVAALSALYIARSFRRRGVPG